MMAAPAIGDLVVYRTRAEFGVARVDIVREGGVTVFPWRHTDRRWARMRQRVAERNVLAVLPPDADPAPIADSFNVLRNRRDADRAAARRRHEERVDRLVSSLGELR